MKLFCAPDSIALAPHIALAESGSNYTFDLIDHHEKVCADGSSYLAVNPKGYVPALQLDDGSILTESIATLQYIADYSPNPALGGGNDRYKVAEWLTFVATELHQRFMRFPQPGISEEMAEETVRQLRERFGFAAARLSSSGYLVGHTLTVADIFLYVASRWLGYKEIDIADWPVLQAFYLRMAERPSVKRALAEEGLE